MTPNKRRHKTLELSSKLTPQGLRKASTDAERKLWALLRSRHLAGWKFRRQAPIDHYIVDFVCFDARLIIEVDGGHHQEQVAYDEVRTDYLKNQGFRVLRFWNNQALKEIDPVQEAILAELGAFPGASTSGSRDNGDIG